MSLLGAHDSSPSVENDLEILTAQADYHMRKASDLRYQINRFAPISILPPEILCRIFRHIRDSCVQDAHRMSAMYTPVVLRWIRVTHICRHWRNVGLQDPGLWADIPLEYPRWAKEMLWRSKNADLSVKIQFGRVQSSLVFDVGRQAHRLVELTLFHPPDLNKLFEVEWGPICAPRLQKLCILYSPFHQRERFLLGGQIHGTDKLRHLELDGVDISWDSCLLKSLTTLSLQNLSASHQQTWSQFSAMINRMPDLQSLTLKKSILSSETVEKAAHASLISLPSLKKLCLDDNAKTCWWFFEIDSHSQRLETSDCFFSVTDTETALDLGAILSSAAQASLETSLKASARSLAISRDLPIHQRQSVLSFSMTTTILDLRMPWDRRVSAVPAHEFKFNSRPLSNIDEANRASAGILQALCFRNLQELDLSYLAVWASTASFLEAVAQNFGELPSLYNLILGRKTATPIINILTVTPIKPLGEDGDYVYDSDDSEESIPDLEGQQASCPSPSSTPSSPPSAASLPFPALRNLKLMQADFGGEMTHAHVALELENLKSCLSSRRNHGVEIYLLVLEHCEQLSARDVAELSILARHVEWDFAEHFE